MVRRETARRSRAGKISPTASMTRVHSMVCLDDLDEAKRIGAHSKAESNRERKRTRPIQKNEL